LLFYPFFFMLDTGTPVIIWAALVMLFALCNDLTLASQATMMSELFAAEQRFTGVTFTREVTGAIIGGTTPVVAAALENWSFGGTWAIVVYCAVLSLLSVPGAIMLKEPPHLQRRRGSVASPSDTSAASPSFSTSGSAD